MPELSMAQLIYTNVEKEQSPQRVGGFQTLFYTRDLLSAKDVEDIESRLLYVTSASNPIKRVYDVLPNGTVLCARINVLLERDSAFRSGRYFAHALLIAPNDFQRVYNNPHAIFANAKFMSTVDEARGSGDMATGDISPQLLSESAMYSSLDLNLSAWSTTALQQLMLLGCHAGELLRERVSVTVTGDEEHILNATRTALALTPARLRTTCSFDTHFYRCNPLVSRYWLIGFPDGPRDADYHFDSQSLTFVEGRPQQPSSRFEDWAYAMLAQGRRQELVTHVDNADLFIQWLLGESPNAPTWGDLPDDISEGILETNLEPARRRLTSAISREYARTIAERIMPRFMHRAQMCDMLNALRSGLDVEQVEVLLCDEYAEAGYRRPPLDEVESLAPILQSFDHSGLHLLYAAWSDQPSMLRTAISQLSAQDYEGFLPTAIQCRLGHPLDWFCVDHAEDFCIRYVQYVPDEELSFTDLTTLLLDCGKAALLDRLQPHLTRSTWNDLRSLSELTASTDVVSGPFREAVLNAVATVGEPVPQGRAGYLGRLTRIFNKKR